MFPLVVVDGDELDLLLGLEEGELDLVLGRIVVDTGGPSKFLIMINIERANHVRK